MGVTFVPLSHLTIHMDISLRTGTVQAIMMDASLNCNDTVHSMDNNVYYTNSYIHVLSRENV